MLTEKQLTEYLQELSECSDKIDGGKIIRMIYRKGYVHGCNDSDNAVKE